MVNYYPAFLDLRGKRCLVAGGGEVALRKVTALLEAGAQATVVSPQLCPDLERLAEEGRLQAWLRPYCPGDLEGMWLAIAATDDPEVNGALAAEAQARGLLLNVVDDPARCNFILPSVVRRGDLVVAISTGGKSPALARKMREELERWLPQEYAALAELLSQVRQEARRQGRRVSPQRWQKSLTQDILDMVRQGDMDKARESLLARLGVGDAGGGS